MRFLGRGFLRNPHKLPLAPLRRGLLRNPHKLPLAPCSKLFSLTDSSSELGNRSMKKSLRRDGDSNPGNPFEVYTLSRRAS